MKDTRKVFLLFLLMAAAISGCRIGDCGCPMTYEEKKEGLYKNPGEDDWPGERPARVEWGSTGRQAVR